MRKLFLLLSLVALSATQSFAYEGHKYGDNSLYFQLSPNAEWIAGGEDGIIVICHTPDSTVYTYESDYSETYYQYGMGNALSNTGIYVGATDNYTPAYWQNGVWTPLPMKDGKTMGLYTEGDAITPDGSVICGCLGLSSSFGEESDSPTYLPIVWTRNADGTYSEYEILPHPNKDFTGRTPQYVTARYISDDGCTVAGQVMSYDGFASYPIVYTKSADGEWSYKTYGVEAIFDYDGDLPPYPSYNPYDQYPSVEDYMTDEDKANYAEAYQAYQDSLDLYNAGAIEKYPHYPTLKEYLSDPTAYNKAMDAYNEAEEAYNDSVAAFEEVYYTYFTGASFIYNTVSLSGNGKYLAQTIQMENSSGGDDYFDDPWGTSSLITTPVLFDLESGEMSMVDATDMQTSSVTNDGTMFAASPATEYTRQAYVIEMGSTEPVRFDKWMATKCEPMADWMNENMLYDVTNYVWDDEAGEYLEEETPDSLITGSLVSNAEGTCFITYVADQWVTGTYDSYLMNIADPSVPTAIKAIANKPSANLNISVADGTISADGMKSFELYDMQGRKMASASGSLRANVANGIYVVRGIAANGSTIERKVAVGSR